MLQLISLQKSKDFSGIRICRIARIQAIEFLIQAIRKIRILKAFSCVVSGFTESPGFKPLIFDPGDS
jgi:hypothetical protein